MSIYYLSIQPATTLEHLSRLFEVDPNISQPVLLLIVVNTYSTTINAAFFSIFIFSANILC